MTPEPVKYVSYVLIPEGPANVSASVSGFAGSIQVAVIQNSPLSPSVVEAGRQPNPVEEVLVGRIQPVSDLTVAHSPNTIDSISLDRSPLATGLPTLGVEYDPLPEVDNLTILTSPTAPDFSVTHSPNPADVSVNYQPNRPSYIIGLISSPEAVSEVSTGILANPVSDITVVRAPNEITNFSILIPPSRPSEVFSGIMAVSMPRRVFAMRLTKPNSVSEVVTTLIYDTSIPVVEHSPSSPSEVISSGFVETLSDVSVAYTPNDVSEVISFIFEPTDIPTVLYTPNPVSSILAEDDQPISGALTITDAEPIEMVLFNEPDTTYSMGSNWGYKMGNTNYSTRTFHGTLYEGSSTRTAHITEPFMLGATNITRKQWASVMGPSPDAPELIPHGDFSDPGNLDQWEFNDTTNQQITDGKLSFEWPDRAYPLPYEFNIPAYPYIRTQVSLEVGKHYSFKVHIESLIPLDAAPIPTWGTNTLDRDSMNFHILTGTDNFYTELREEEELSWLNHKINEKDGYVIFEGVFTAREETQYLYYKMRSYFGGTHTISLISCKEVPTSNYVHPGALNPQYDDSPDSYMINNINLPMALDFCAQLTKNFRARGLLKDGWAFSLPKEVHYEYAMRGDSTKEYPWDSNEVDYTKVESVENPVMVGGPKNGIRLGYFAGGDLPKIKQYPPNSYGIYDTSGKLWNACLDVFRNPNNKTWYDHQALRHDRHPDQVPSLLKRPSNYYGENFYYLDDDTSSWDFRESDFLTSALTTNNNLHTNTELVSAKGGQEYWRTWASGGYEERYYLPARIAARLSLYWNYQYPGMGLRVALYKEWPSGHGHPTGVSISYTPNAVSSVGLFADDEPQAPSVVDVIINTDNDSVFDPDDYFYKDPNITYSKSYLDSLNNSSRPIYVGAYLRTLTEITYNYKTISANEYLIVKSITDAGIVADCFDTSTGETTDISLGGFGSSDHNVKYEMLEIPILPADYEEYLAPTTANNSLENGTDYDLELIFCPEGTYLQGSSSDNREVTITNGFYLSKHEVTQAQYKAVMTGNTGGFDVDPSCKSSFDPNEPVNYLTYDAIETFVDRLNTIEAGNIPRGWKYDLPTEAQWEYACRAGTTTNYYTGTSLTQNDANYLQWQYNGYTMVKVGPAVALDVGSYPANPWGFFDMYGNAEEWVKDWYTSSLGNTAVTDPTGPTSGTMKTARGGKYSNTNAPTSHYRMGREPASIDCGRGFRVALVPENLGTGFVPRGRFRTTPQEPAEITAITHADSISIEYTPNPPSFVKSGTVSDELLTNNDFQNGLEGFTEVNGTGSVVTYDGANAYQFSSNSLTFNFPQLDPGWYRLEFILQKAGTDPVDPIDPTTTFYGNHLAYVDRFLPTDSENISVSANWYDENDIVIGGSSRTWTRANRYWVRAPWIFNIYLHDEVVAIKRNYYGEVQEGLSNTYRLPNNKFRLDITLGTNIPDAVLPEISFKKYSAPHFYPQNLIDDVMPVTDFGYYTESGSAQMWTHEACDEQGATNWSTNTKEHQNRFYNFQ